MNRFDCDSLNNNENRKNILFYFCIKKDEIFFQTKNKYS